MEQSKTERELAAEHAAFWRRELAKLDRRVKKWKRKQRACAKALRGLRAKRLWLLKQIPGDS